MTYKEDILKKIETMEVGDKIAWPLSLLNSVRQTIISYQFIERRKKLFKTKMIDDTIEVTRYH